MKVLISTTSFGEYDDSCLNLLKRDGFEFICNPYGRKIKPNELIELAKDAVGLIAGTESLTEKVLLKLSNLKVISRCGAGLENIDLDAAKRLNIKVFNTPDAPTTAVAELTIGLIFNLLRKINSVDVAIKNGKWEKLMGNLLYGKNVGIVGFGRIGRKLAKLLGPFNCKIAYADHFVEDNLLGLKRLSLLELLQWADIITIHASNKDTVIGEKEIRQMKKGAWLVNTSRGGLIDEAALYRALRDGDLSGAALDVFSEEPYVGHLRELDNIILTPHIGSYAREARIEMEKEAVKNLLKGLEVIK